MTQKMSPKRLASLEREAQAVELRKRGATYRQIGLALGISGKSAYNLIQRAFAKLEKQSATGSGPLRALEIERLDAMRNGLWDKATQGDVNAVAACLKISERLAKLTGLDQPVQVETKTKVEQQLTEEQLRAMAELYVDANSRK
ncbi:MULTISPECIES: helix-turn-helix transcriptional regulator [Burkholderia]|uniref:helix-turn-helix transcriptional regulator n=1 Tax=Burkholderia TaxID=32008 RepID=UPI000A841B3D|nr:MULTISPECIES: helix-turn-helix transcriptional regulator [Burkholderia]QRM23529.1 helix-turn-helix transcriptional regulator [Burkholderia pseudomallei]